WLRHDDAPPEQLYRDTLRSRGALHLALVYPESAQLESRIHGPHVKYPLLCHPIEGDAGAVADRCDGDPHRVDDHAVADTDGWRMVGRRDEERVLERPCGDEGAPVVLLQRPAHPLAGAG